MATGLDVWVAAPGSACATDDGAWLVTVHDAHGGVFTWAGDTYADLDAPHAHWAGTIPPGTYVVRARQREGTLVTDRAIVAVDCQQFACVRLYVGDGDGETPPPSPRCEVAVESVTPLARQHHVVSVTVTGTATACQAVEVTVECDETREARATVPVQDGAWEARLDVNEMSCRCGDTARITVRCVEDGDCSTVHEATLDCGEDRPRPTTTAS